MSETPAWLSTDNAGGGGDNFEMTSGITASEPVATPTGGGSTTSGTVGGSTTTSGAAAEDNDLPGIILTMRLANMGVAVALVACSVCNVMLRYVTRD